MTEAELVEKLAIAYEDDGHWNSLCEAERRHAVDEMQRVLPVIRSHTQALVAAAYARATNLIAQFRDDYHSNDGPFDMGMRLQILENEVCSLTPADAVRDYEWCSPNGTCTDQ